MRRASARWQCCLGALEFGDVMWVLVEEMAIGLTGRDPQGRQPRARRATRTAHAGRAGVGDTRWAAARGATLSRWRSAGSSARTRRMRPRSLRGIADAAAGRGRKVRLAAACAARAPGEAVTRRTL